MATSRVEAKPRFGELLREFRLAAGLSQEMLAERAAISVNGISALERGASRAPQRETLSLLVNALQLDVEQQRALEQAAIRPLRLPVRQSRAPEVPTNLPRWPSSFVGRENEIAELGSLIDGHQLVTVVGSGGVGKTRTSLQVVAGLLNCFHDGVWFIEMAPLSSGEYISSTVAQALGIAIAADGNSAENLARALKAKNVLLLFDNCEHLIAHTAAVISSILRSCPNVKIVATSRQRLGIGGETIYRLPALANSSAVALFVDRAWAIDKRFEVTDENAVTIAEICGALDGLPLAIELAASRVNIFSPQQLQQRLSERFQILTSGNRDALPRQQTLFALIDWSYGLLDEAERSLFSSLGIFVNGFTIEGAVAVGELPEFGVVDNLASLVDKSLVLAEEDSNAPRYRLLESTRLYAREKLRAAGDWDECARRHLRYFTALFFDEGQRYQSTGKNSSLTSALVTELEDVRAALDRAVEHDPSSGAELLASIGPFWRTLGLHVEGIARIQAMLSALGGEQQYLRARLWATVSFLAGELVDPALQSEAAAQAVTNARACGDAPVLVEALLRFARSAAVTERFDDANAALREADAIGGLPAALRLQLLGVRAVVSMIAGDLATAGKAYERLRKEQRSLGNATEERGTIVNLAENEHARGETQRAIALLRESLPEFEASGDRTMLATAFANLAGYLNAIDDGSGASEMARRAICELSPQGADATDVAISIEHLALATALSGDLAKAAILEGYADAALRKLGFKRQFTEAKSHDRVVKLLRERLIHHELTELLAEGQTLSAEAAVAFALEEI